MLELAAVLVQDKKKLTKRPELTDPDVVSMSDDLKAKIAAKHDMKGKVWIFCVTTHDTISNEISLIRLEKTTGYSLNFNAHY